MCLKSESNTLTLRCITNITNKDRNISEMKVIRTATDSIKLVPTLDTMGVGEIWSVPAKTWSANYLRVIVSIYSNASGRKFIVSSPSGAESVTITRTL